MMTDDDDDGAAAAAHEPHQTSDKNHSDHVHSSYRLLYYLQIIDIFNHNSQYLIGGLGDNHATLEAKWNCQVNNNLKLVRHLYKLFVLNVNRSLNNLKWNESYLDCLYYILKLMNFYLIDAVQQQQQQTNAASTSSGQFETPRKKQKRNQKSTTTLNDCIVNVQYELKSNGEHLLDIIDHEEYLLNIINLQTIITSTLYKYTNMNTKLSLKTDILNLTMELLCTSLVTKCHKVGNKLRMLFKVGKSFCWLDTIPRCGLAYHVYLFEVEKQICLFSPVADGEGLLLFLIFMISKNCSNEIFPVFVLKFKAPRIFR
jgi:hypothetical protein